MTRIVHHTLAAIVAVLITATTFTEVMSVPANSTNAAPAVQVA
jgi:hypothetical protein